MYSLLNTVVSAYLLFLYFYRTVNCSTRTTYSGVRLELTEFRVNLSDEVNIRIQYRAKQLYLMLVFYA